MRQTTRRFLLVVGLASINIGVSAIPANAAHLNGYDSVDGREIRYENSTKYDGALSHGISEWNAVGSADYKPDSATAIADLEFVDVTQPSEDWAGGYNNRPGLIDKIYLNKSYMEGYSIKYRRNVMVHEMGHALGIADHTSSSWDAIMYSGLRGWQEVHSHDVVDYKKLW